MHWLVERGNHADIVGADLSARGESIPDSRREAAGDWESQLWG